METLENYDTAFHSLQKVLKHSLKLDVQKVCIGM